MSVKTNAFFSFPNESRLMKDKDKVTPWLPWLSTSLLRFSSSVEISNELEFSMELREGGSSDPGAENQRNTFSVENVKRLHLALWSHRLSWVQDQFC